MKRHVMSITYEPKIQPVQDGECLQTIRRGNRFAVGDSILIHGWAGLPYRSKWNGKMRVTVTKAIDVKISFSGIRFLDGFLANWNSTYAELLARADYIDPPTGTTLRDVLFGLNGAPSKPEEYQIIRWEIDEAATFEYRKEAERDNRGQP